MPTNVTFVSSTIRTKLFCFVVVLLLLPAGMAVAQTMPADAVVIKKPEYELFYMPQYREDGERAARLLDQTVAAAKAKYGITYRGVPCTVNLYPSANSRASNERAQIETSFGGTAPYTVPVTRCVVHILSWSSPDWKATTISAHGIPQDIEYWNHLLVHEYITVFISLSYYEKPMGWKETSAPNWWIQGLQEFDGFYHSTAASLARARGVMRDGRLGVQQNKTQVVCCRASDGTAGMGVTNAYVDGLALVAFFAEQFGEDVHRRIVRSEERTFEDAVVRETGWRIEDIFRSYAGWLRR